jgi:glycosyltransferase involved in cell wall biosynthesis
MTVSPRRKMTLRKLKLLNVTASIDPAAGGVSESILRLSRALIDLGHAVEIVSADAPGSAWTQDLSIPVHMKGPPRGPLEYSQNFNLWLKENCGRFDVIISHGLWRDNSRATRRFARVAGRPYFIFPHGMLDPWFKRQYPLKHLKKCLFWWWTEYAVVRDARAVLFACEEELLLARQTFWPYRCIERVVPLGTLEPPDNADVQRVAFLQCFPEMAKRRVILFLGRLHEKKGCDLLLQAFLNLLQTKPRETWQDLHLMIAGPCAQSDYLNALKQLAARCEAIFPGCVSFPGMISREIKWGALRHADVFILPSHQENFGIAVVEALACGTPVLISNQVNIWREIESSGAGLVDADTADGCGRLIERWLNLADADKIAMADRAVAAFRGSFEITQTALSLVDTITSFEGKAS